MKSLILAALLMVAAPAGAQCISGQCGVVRRTVNIQRTVQRVQQPIRRLIVRPYAVCNGPSCTSAIRQRSVTRTRLFRWGLFR